MKRHNAGQQTWETPSLQWIHEVRRERQLERAGQPPRPLPRKESEQLAKRYGLRLVRLATVER